MQKLCAVIIAALAMTLNCYAFSARDYRSDTEQGYADAQYDLGRCYANGEGVTQDCFEAVKWYRKAAEQGDPDAQSALKDLGETW